MRDIDFKTLKTLNILYVEDEVGIQDEMRINLENFFGSFKVASDGVEGLKLFDESIDIVISDIKMPNLDGLAMVESIKNRRDVLVVLTTAFKEINYLQKAIDLSVDGYISKPVDIKKLLRLLSKISSKIVKQRLEAQLTEMNIRLKEMVEEQVREILLKDRLLTRQSKYVLMGEMVDAIAHQFKTPLSIINMLGFNLSNEFDRELSKDELNQISIKIQKQVIHLNQTIDEFRGFLREDKNRVKFLLLDIVNRCLTLLNDDIKRAKIIIDIDIESNFIIDGYPNEFIHIFLNLIQNSKDAFIQRDILNRKISFKTSNGKILYSDSGGGVDTALICKMFDLNFTTKEQGSGLGLYLCRLILEKIDYKISAKNFDDGLVFQIEKIE